MIVRTGSDTTLTLMSDTDNDDDKVKFLTPLERRSHPKKFECRAAIAKHLATVGSRDWPGVMAQFPEIPKPTFWRWVKELKKEVPAEPELASARKKLKSVEEGAKILRHEEAKASGVGHIAKDLPAAPSPAYVSREGARAMANLDFTAEIGRLYSDAEALRTYSVTKDDAGNERIKNPLTFDRSVARRVSILETGLKALQELWDLRMMQSFYDSIIAEIGAESPEVQQRILKRLAELNQRTGMTMSMRL